MAAAWKIIVAIPFVLTFIVCMAVANGLRMKMYYEVYGDIEGGEFVPSRRFGLTDKYRHKYPHGRTHINERIALLIGGGCFIGLVFYALFLGHFFEFLAYPGRST